MSCEERKPDLVALVTGNLPEQEAAALRAHLRDCPRCRRALQEYRAAWVHLDLWQDAPLPAGLQEPRVPASRRPVLMRWHGWAAAAALILVSLLVYHLWDRAGPRGTAVPRQGLLLADGSHQPIALGRAISTGKSERAQLRLAKGTVVALSGSSRVLVRERGHEGARELELDSGCADVTAAPGSLIVRLPGGSVHVTGTEFRVRVTRPNAVADGRATASPIFAVTEVTVYKGRVHTTSTCGADMDVAPGERHIQAAFGEAGIVRGRVVERVDAQDIMGDVLRGIRLELPECGQADFFMIPGKAPRGAPATSPDIEAAFQSVLGKSRAPVNVAVQFTQQMGRLFITGLSLLGPNEDAGAPTWWCHDGLSARERARMLRWFGPGTSPEDWNKGASALLAEARPSLSHQAIRMLAERADRGVGAVDALDAISRLAVPLPGETIPGELYGTLYRALRCGEEAGAWRLAATLLGRLKDRLAVPVLCHAQERLTDIDAYPTSAKRYEAGQWCSIDLSESVRRLQQREVLKAIRDAIETVARE